jgi:nitroreductase
MEFFDAIKKRFSCRAFLEQEVEEEKLQKILDAANSAPSAGNMQAYEIVLAKDPERKKALATAALGQGFIEKASVVLVFFANPSRSGRRYGSRGEQLYCIQDATIAAAFAQLAATAQGLASVWVGAFDDATVKKVCNASEQLKPVAILPIGYPAAKPSASGRRFLQDLVKEEGF